MGPSRKEELPTDSPWQDQVRFSERETRRQFILRQADMAVALSMHSSHESCMAVNVLLTRSMQSRLKRCSRNAEAVAHVPTLSWGCWVERVEDFRCLV